VEFLRAMDDLGDGWWSTSVPLHAGGLSYWYRVTDPAQGWDDHRIWDPASTYPRPPGDAAYRVTHDDVLDVVHVPYADRQDDPTLAVRATDELPREDAAERGTVTYVDYTTILGDAGHFLGVYLPPGYDEDRPEPYPVVYLAHGIGGDETDFMIPANVPTILDNLIGRGEVAPTVAVTMGNHFTSSSLDADYTYDQQNAADNLVRTILPFVERRFHVATDRAGRAFGGFSYGGSTGGLVMSSYPETFRYYGLFSPQPSLSPDYAALTRALRPRELVVFLGNGAFEGPLAIERPVAEALQSRGFTAATAQVAGAHDAMTAGQLFTTYARDHLWR
jgi:enterochelin esterase-like enzyme